MSALLAALPILLVLVLMLGLGWPASRAGIAGAALALAVALFGFGLGTEVLAEVGVLGSVAGVAAEATFTSATILWIILPALAIYHLQVATRGTDVLRVALGRLSDDPRILALLIAWFFTLFMEGGAGFGSPVALAAPFLVGIGYNPLVAVVIAMIGNAVGVSFGAIGTPVVPMVAATGLDPLELSAASAIYHLAFGLFPLVLMMFLASRGTGTRMRGAIWAWTVFAAAAFLVPMWLLATFVGPELPTLGGALIGGGIFIAVLLLVRRLRPQATAPAAEELPIDIEADRGALLRAGAPYAILITLVLATRLVPFIAQPLSAVEIAWDLDGGFTGSFQPLTHPGTLLVVSFLLGALAQKARTSTVSGALGTTIRQLVPVTIALLAMLLLARTMVRSGMTQELAAAAAGATASAWPVLAPLVGVLGTFVTGSGTASNVLFTDLQVATADQLGYSQLPLLGAQNFGAAAGNSIAPHNIVAGGATVGLTGSEADVMRRTIGFALVYGLLGGALALLLV
ncbi:MAG: L-lactate permease [Halorubrum sp.]|uniref:L-lactate permease n=1 Tax=Halorubrum sp. TaxID=1879286 RepID=UPI00397069AD